MAEPNSDLAILVEGLTKSFGEVHALAWRRPRGAARHGPGRARARTAPARPPPCASSRRCCGPTAAAHWSSGHDVVRQAAAVRRSIGLAGQSAAIQEELTGRENLEHHRPAHHLSWPRRAPPRPRTARAVRSRRCRRPPGQGVLRRHAAPPRSRREPGRPPRGAVPRRADHRPRPALAAWHVGDHPVAGRAGHDLAADHPVPRRGRRTGRRDRRHRPRQGDRRGHLGAAEGPHRRRRPRVHRAPTPPVARRAAAAVAASARASRTSTRTPAGSASASAAAARTR